MRSSPSVSQTARPGCSQSCIYLLCSLPLYGALQCLVERRFGALIFLGRNSTLQTVGFQLENRFLQSVHQPGGAVLRAPRKSHDGVPVRGVNENRSRSQKEREHDEEEPLSRLERIRHLVGDSESATGATGFRLSIRASRGFRLSRHLSSSREFKAHLFLRGHALGNVERHALELRVITALVGRVVSEGELHGFRSSHHQRLYRQIGSGSIFNV